MFVVKFVCFALFSFCFTPTALADNASDATPQLEAAVQDLVLAANTPHVFEAGELEAERRVDAVYPRFADRSAGTVTCASTVTVDRSGVPTDVSVDGCDPVFMGAAMKTLLRWRFEAPTVDGRSVIGQTRVDLTFDVD